MNETDVIRAGVFFGVFSGVAVWEAIAPRRPLAAKKAYRWANNLAVVLLGALSLRLFFPLLAFDLAFLARQSGWGVLNSVHIPYWPSVIIGILALDLVIYLQHVLFHALPVFWRLHMMHHADLDVDLTTGLRFHPIEIMLSMLIKMAAVLVIGPLPAAVLLFEALLNATSLFNHGNASMPGGMDRILRLLVVTPDMHRVHHSVAIRETNSNFGFNFPWWDRIFGTYRPQPAAGHAGMTIGLSQFRDVRYQNVVRMLLMPFTGRTGPYAIGGHGREPMMK